MSASNTLYNLMGAPRPFDTANKYTSSYCVSTLILALTRLLFAVYAFTTLFFQLAYESTVHSEDQRWTARHHLSYFTNLCYWGLAFYLLMSGVHTLAHYITSRQQSTVKGGGGRLSFWHYLNLTLWPRPLQALHAILYSTAMTFPPLVTIVFWGVLYRNPWWPDEFDGWKNVRLLSSFSLPNEPQNISFSIEY